MPNRILKESICRSDEIDSLSWFEEVLFYRLIVNCDDYGRYDARLKIVKNTCFPLKDVTERDVEKALNKLSEVGLILVYEAQGRPVLQLITWEKHQRVRNQKSKYPAFDNACKLLLTNDSKCQQKILNDDSCICNEFSSETETITVSKDTNCRSDIQRAVEAWNELEAFGIKKISRLTNGTKRYDLLKARIKEYGMDEVLFAINRIKSSDYLRGRSKNGWTITFDWFVLPNNFIKVHDGNYDSNTPMTDLQPKVSNENWYGQDVFERLANESRGDFGD